MANITFTLSGIGTFPINPAALPRETQGRNEVVEVVGLGEVVVPRQYSLTTTSIESYLTDVSYENKILEAWHTLKPLKYTVSGLNRKAMQVLIQNFQRETRAGEESDIYFTLDLIEYVPYGAILVPMVSDNTATKPLAKRVDNKATTPSSYTVKSGDSLWAITQRLTGNGSNWRELYEANKSTISNANLIYPGDNLIIPSGW